MIQDLIKKNRSYRRFYQDRKIPFEKLKKWVDMARLSPSGANLQPLKYYLSNDSNENLEIFETLRWAGYLKEWPGPAEGEHPSAYIVIVHDKQITESIGCDQGFAAQTILLGAVENGCGGCVIASIDKPRLAEILALPNHLEILMVIALGYPKESVRIEPMTNPDQVSYWRDAKQIHHVPKRPISEILLNPR